MVTRYLAVLALLVACKSKEPKKQPPPPPPVAPAPAPSSGGGGIAIAGSLSNAMTDALAMTCAQVARDVKGNQGTSWYMRCPPGCAGGPLWGTDLYTDDSSVCHAAIHAGGIAADKGGTVLVTWTPGQMLYPGWERNGVSSSSWGKWGRSFFVQAVDAAGKPTTPPVVPSPPGTAKAACNSVGENLEGDVGAKWRIICPAGCKAGVYGTDVYTKDSSICTAAVHAGLIPPDKAGEADLVIDGPQKAFQGSTRNGITTTQWGEFGGSFRFVK